MASETLITVRPEKRATRQRLKQKLMDSATFGSIIMVAAAVIAIIIANSAAYEVYEEVLNFELGFSLTGFGLHDFFIGLTVEEWINDVLMTLFFLCVGMEIKYEFYAGELRDIRAALLPIIAACGGVLMPIIIYSVFNFGGEHAKGFGIPMATDIAFAIGVLSLVGKGIPKGLSVFLKTLAIADDIMAIIVIALFYGQSPSPFWLAMAAVMVVILMVFNRLRIYSLKPYLVFGTALWFCVFFSGVEATIAGVVLAFTIPIKSHINPRVFGKWTIAKVLEARDRFIPGEPIVAQGDYADTVHAIHRVSKHVEPPLNRLERALSPWSNYFILPVFAFFNAGVHLSGIDLGATITDPVVLGVFFGLFLGKPIGITLASLACVKSKLTPMPTHCNWHHMIGAGMLGGIGFTMAIYVANLSFTGADAASITMVAKAAILCASVASGVCGVLFLKAAVSHDRKAGKTLDEPSHLEQDIEEDIAELTEISRTATDTEMGEGEYLILTNELGHVSEEALVEAFKEAINEGDVAYRHE